jgi:hypothetical protein
MLLYLKGRKSGSTYLQPVSFVRDGETLLTPGGGRWKLNLREGECIRIRLTGRERLARPELIRNVSEVQTLLRKMIAVNPRITSFAPVAGPQGRVDQRRVEDAVQYGFAIVRWHLDCPPAVGSHADSSRR